MDKPQIPTRIKAEPAFQFNFRQNRVHGEKPLNGAVYGDFGIGKTYLVGTMYRHVVAKPVEDIRAWGVPENIAIKRTILFVNAEKGDDGIPQDCDELLVHDIYSYKDFSLVYDFLKLHVKYKREKNWQALVRLQRQFLKIPDAVTNVPLLIFDGVAIDSLTEVQKYCVYQLIGLSQESKLEDEPEYMNMRQWGVALEMILLMVRNFRDLDLHKMFVIQQIEDKDEKNKLFYRPALQGQAKASILGFFDFVMYYKMAIQEGGILRRGFLLPVGAFKAKHRFEKFRAAYIDNPTFELILQAKAGQVSHKK